VVAQQRHQPEHFPLPQPQRERDRPPRAVPPRLGGSEPAEQEREQRTAADLWCVSGYVFTTANGGLIHPRTDHKHWKQLLDRAGVPDRRLHDALHAAATVLLLLGVPERTVMGVMGWSNTAMAARYQHITAAIRRDVAERVGGLLWRPGTDAGARGEGPRPAA
jgi:integrase